MSRYRPGRKSRKMYRHYERYGTAGMSRKQLRALAREMDIGVNPRRRGRRISVKLLRLDCRNTVNHRGKLKIRHTRRRNPRSRYYKGRRFTRAAWNPKGWARRDHRGYKDGGARRNRKIQKMLERHRDNWRRTGGRRNPVLMNPKRDGSMTRGEKRLQKHAEWLREIADRGRKATAMLKSMRTVPAASHVAAAEHAADKLNEVTIEKAMDGEPKAVAKVEQVVEHAEAKVIRQRLEDLRILVEDLDTQIKEAEAMNDEALAEELMEQKVKVAKQRTALKQKADGLAIMTNPRRRTVLIGTRAYARALAELKAAIRRRPRRLVTF